MNWPDAVRRVTSTNDILDSREFARDQINLLRSKYHELLMTKMRDEGIYFFDRFDTTGKAFEIVGKAVQL